MNRERSLMVGAFLLVAAAYIIASARLRPDAFFVGDMGVKFVQVESLLRQGFRSLALEYPGAAIDPDADFFPFRPPSTFRADDRIYATFPVAFCALTAIPYSLFGCRGLYLIPLAAGLGIVALVPFLARYLRVRRRGLAMLLVGLGTPIWFYSLLFWEHTLATLLFSGSLFYAVRAFRFHSARDVAWSGIVAGAAPWIRTEMFLALAAMACAYALMAPNRRVRLAALVLYGVGVGLFAIPLVIFNLALYGAPFGAHFLQNIQLDEAMGGGSSWIGALWAKICVLPRHLLFGREFFNIRWRDVVLFTPFLGMMIFWLAPNFRWKRAMRMALLVVAAGVGGYVALTSPTVVGFFAASPAMILGFSGSGILRPPRKSDREKIPFRAGPVSFCFLVSIVFAFLLFATSPVLGGVQFGPRFLLPLYVPVGVLAARVASSSAMGLSKGWNPQISFVAGLALVVVSFIMGVRGMEFARGQKQTAGAIKDEIARTDCRVVVSDMHLLALTGPLYFERMMFCAPDEEALRRLESLLSRHGEEQFLFVTRSVKPAGPVGVAVAASNAPEVPVMRAGEVRFLMGQLQKGPAARR